MDASDMRVVTALVRLRRELATLETPFTSLQELGWPAADAMPSITTAAQFADTSHALRHACQDAAGTLVLWSAPTPFASVSQKV
jgi:hypothetical protein